MKIPQENPNRYTVFPLLLENKYIEEEQKGLPKQTNLFQMSWVEIISLNILNILGDIIMIDEDPS